MGCWDGFSCSWSALEVSGCFPRTSKNECQNTCPPFSLSSNCYNCCACRHIQGSESFVLPTTDHGNSQHLSCPESALQLQRLPTRHPKSLCRLLGGKASLGVCRTQLSGAVTCIHFCYCYCLLSWLLQWPMQLFYCEFSLHLFFRLMKWIGLYRLLFFSLSFFFFLSFFPLSKA